MITDSCEYEFQLDNQFFADLDSPEIQKGKLNVILKVKRTSGVYLLDFHTEGMVVVTCDRCLDEMEQPIESNDTLKVKFGEEFSEIEDIVIVPEEDGYINVAWFIYEFIALNVPMKHVHASGKCNKDMLYKLNRHLCIDDNDDEEADDARMMHANSKSDWKMDPRWDELKKILDNN